MVQSTMLEPKFFFSNYDNYLHDLPVKKIIAAVLLFLGVIFFSIGMWRGYKNKINPSWAYTYGMVLNSSMESVTVPDINKNISNTYYKPKIIYEYEVNGKTHTKTTSAGVISKNEPAMSERIIKKYDDGRLIKIFYNPSHPEEAFISSFSAMDKWVPISIGSLLIIFGLFAVYYLKVEDNVKTKSIQKSRVKSPPTKPKTVSKRIHEVVPNKQLQQINGKWELNYQIPSMGEIESLINQKGNEIRSLASYSIMLTIKDDTMNFSYKDNDRNGCCEIISKLSLNDDQLMLDHKSIDFLLFDIEEFPPKNYSYDLNGSTLVLKTNKIKELGDRQITYNFSKAA